MWRLEKDPYLSSTFGTVSILDRAPDFHDLRARMEAATLEVPRLRWRVQPEPERLRDAGVGRRPRFRHRPPRPSHRPAQAGHAPRAVRPRQPDAARPVRSHPAAVAVHHRRRAARRQGRAVVRRCTTRSPTARAACGCRCSTSTSNATPAPRPTRRRTSDDVAAPPPPASASGTARELARGQLPDPARHRPPGARTARRPDVDPGTPPWRRSTRCAASLTQLVRRPTRPARRCGPTARCAAASRSRAAPFAATKDAARSASAARSTPPSSPPPPTPPAATTPSSASRSTSCGPRWRSAPAPRRPGPTPSPSPGCSCPPARWTSPNASPARPHHAARPRSGRAAGPRSTRWPTVAAALPTSLVTRLARQQAQTVDFATSNVRAAPMPVYIAGAQLLENYPFGPLARRRLQPHAAVVQRQPRHGHQHRRRRRRRTGAAGRAACDGSFKALTRAGR